MPMSDTNVHLSAHTSARNQAVAAKLVRSGTSVISVPAWTTALLLSEKGRRCDHCHMLEDDAHRLRKCTGCASYWYCGPECQNAQWNAYHKRICKRHARFTASMEYNSLHPDEKADAILLSHLIAQVDLSDCFPVSSDDHSSDMAVFLSLLEHEPPEARLPPICSTPSNPALSQELLSKIYLRFGNNNFVLHSHLATFAHGIFPLASRYFNHSCVPNAAPKFIIEHGRLPKMEIVALRDIEEGEEITIPYLDPALPFNSRQEQLKRNYGFTCTCSLCTFGSNVEKMYKASALRGPQFSDELDAKLRRFVFPPTGSNPTIPLPDRPGLYTLLSRELIPVFDDSYLPTLSEQFSKSSHEGDYDIALDVGLTLLALYVLIYPPNYPQTGMHSLEMAKTAWNASVTNEGSDSEPEYLELARTYLLIARNILDMYGVEGDRYGPLQEIAALYRLMI